MANELIKELSPHRHWLVYKKELVTKGKIRGESPRFPISLMGTRQGQQTPIAGLLTTMHKMK